MLLKNKNARAVLATALAVITIFVLTFSVSAYECGNDTTGCEDVDNDGYCDYCGSDGVVHICDRIINGTFDATCTDGGGYYMVCIDCGEECIYYTSDPLGHSYEDGECTACGDSDPDVGGDVECSHLGTSTIVSYEDEKTHKVQCDDCGAIFYEAHTYANGVCPCGKTGVCDGTHAWTEDPQAQVDATAHTEGWREWICQRCGESRKTIIEAEHMMQRGTHSATCTEDGYIIYTCMEGCDYEYKETIPALGGSHTWSGWRAGLVEGCDRYYIRTCSACGTSDTKVEKVHYFNGGATVCACGEYTCIHDWAGSNVLSTPTCTTAGVTEYWCISCQNNGYIADKVERIEAFGHGETYWKSLGDTCAEYCGRCNLKVNTIDHWLEQDEEPWQVVSYDSKKLVLGYYCDRCNTYISSDRYITKLSNVLVLEIDDVSDCREYFDYELFKTYKYIYLVNKSQDVLDSFTFAITNVGNQYGVLDVVLTFSVPSRDCILVEILEERIYYHEKKHRVETVTLNGYETWKKFGAVYSLDYAKNFDKYMTLGYFPEGSVLTADIDTTVHGNLTIAKTFTGTISQLYFMAGQTRPLCVNQYGADLATYIENLKKSPIKIMLEYDEQVAMVENCENMSFFRTLRTLKSMTSSQQYANGYNDAINSVIEKNPVQGMFQGIWSAMVLFFTILGSGITIGNISLSMVFSSVAVLVLISFVVKLLR